MTSFLAGIDPHHPSGDDPPGGDLVERIAAEPAVYSRASSKAYGL